MTSIWRCSQNIFGNGFSSLTINLVEQETGLVFARVLEHAGVYKRSPEGQEAFLRFIRQV